MVLPLLSFSTVFFNSLARSSYFSFFFAFFQYDSVVSRDRKVHILASTLFCRLLLSLVVWMILSDPFASQDLRGVFLSHSPVQILGCLNTIYSYGQISISCPITLPTQSCLVLYSYCTIWLHSLIKWLIMLSRSPQMLHLLFCCLLFRRWQRLIYH